MCFLSPKPSSANNHFMNRKLGGLNNSLLRLINTLYPSRIQITSPDLNVNFSPNMFCNDGIHVSFSGNKFFSLLLAQLTCLNFHHKLTLLVADQTHCHICKRFFQKKAYGVICKAYIHVSCSRLQSSKFYYDGFSCKQCTPENFAKGPISNNRPSRTTQKETSPATPETNVRPNATQSNPSPLAITTARSTPGNLSTMNLKLKQTTYVKMSSTGNRAS